jgi:hypothetical protein
MCVMLYTSYTYITSSHALFFQYLLSCDVCYAILMLYLSPAQQSMLFLVSNTTHRLHKLTRAKTTFKYTYQVSNKKASVKVQIG